MRYCILAVALACAAYVFLCGCGTTLNLANNEQKVFGGTRIDVEVATVGLVHEARQGGTELGPGDLPAGLQVILAVCAWIDLPFTLAGDTVTLPWTVSAELKRLFEPRTKLKTESSLPPSATP
jgi:uncharacterized protein YceK